MTVEQVAALGPAFTDYLRCFSPCFVTKTTFAHLGTYCRGLPGDLTRKSVEPIALAGGGAVRTLQEFLAHHAWDHGRMRDEVQRRVAREHLPAPGSKPAGGIGTVGWIDETSVAKRGDKTPGVQRQYCGASGKIDNCIVTVHLACRCGPFMTLLDGDLFLPELRLQRPAQDRSANAPEGCIHAGWGRARVPSGQDRSGVRPLRGPPLQGIDTARDLVPTGAVVRRRANRPASGGKIRRSRSRRRPGR